MQKIYNSSLQINVVKIFPGEFYVSTDNEVISTLLGSCISVCLYDVTTGIGGMNHFMLPDDPKQKEKIQLDKSHINKSFHAARYGVSAMEILILEMQKKGAFRTGLSAKVFGGGRTVRQDSAIEGVGIKNIRFIQSYLKMEGIPLEVENTGDHFARKVLFNTGDNSVQLEKIEMQSALDTESRYKESLTLKKPEQNIIYF